MRSAGDSCVGYSVKHCQHGVNVQFVTDPAGRLLWIAPALSGPTQALTAARTHRICNWRTPGGGLTLTQRTVNRALVAARAHRLNAASHD